MLHQADKLKQRLSHASGALADIMCIVTSSIPQDAPESVKQAMGAVVSRILSSADCVRRPPSYYVHDYERVEWERYMSGEAKACATDRPCIEVAKELQP